jgi:hypothetical protein
MADQTAAASSPAEVDVFNGQQPTMAEYSQYRDSGELPERFKVETADPAPADAPKEVEAEGEEPETEPESDPVEAQEQPQKGSAAEKRIKQLLAKTKELERKLADAAKPTQSDSSTAQAPQQPQNYQQYRQAFKPSLFIEEFGKKNPEATYEDANAAMADHLYEVRKHFDGIETRIAAERQALEAKVGELRNVYENYDEIKDAFLSKVLSPTGAPLIPIDVLGAINDSDEVANLLYTIGGDEKTLNDFIALAQRNPRAAIKKVGWFEGQIAETLANAKETPVRGNDGKFTKAPEKQQTSAPKPPSPVSGGSSRAFDVNDESLSADEWMRKRNKALGVG